MLNHEPFPILPGMEKDPPGLRDLLRLRNWAKGLFWSWNAIFLAFVLLGFAPQMLPMMLVAVQAGDIPPSFLGYALALTLVPVAVVLIGFYFLRHSPTRLFALGYGVEGPLMLVLLIRFFLLREATLPAILLLGSTGVGLVTFLWQLLDRSIEERMTPLLFLRSAGLTLLLLAGLYASIWLAFYAIPGPFLMAEVLGNIWQEAGRFLRDLWLALAEFDWRSLWSLPWQWVPFWGLGLILLAFTGVLLVAMPVAVIVLYAQAWAQSVQTLVQRSGRLRSLALVVGVAAASVLLVVMTSRQPQQRAFALLAVPPTSHAEAQALLERQDDIRVGLLNAYLAPFRYVGAVGELNHVSDLYQQAFKLPAQNASTVQWLYEWLLRPMLYVPVHPVEHENTWRPWSQSALQQEPLQAAQLYERFFDSSIVDGEREAVIGAVRSTWSADRAQAALQVVDDRAVHLERQEISVSEHGDWAEIELYEVYQNRTSQRQEVVYYFSLPESAVVTGLWLGNSPQRQAAFTHQVAPRGAAQAVYRQEVLVSNMDPALIEQIGPTQYRLRIYPVEPQIWEDLGDRTRPRLKEGPPLHLWMTWRVLAVDDEWSLPRLADKRNIYWDSASVRLVNGQPMTGDEETWLPAAVPASAPVQPVPHLVHFVNGDTVIARPLAEVDLPALPIDLRLAVVIDRSRSMAAHAEKVDTALTTLSIATGDAASVHVYLTASPYRGEAPKRVGLAQMVSDPVLYYGGQNAAELLLQFDQLRGEAVYDGIVVLTDGTGYELSADGIEVPVPNTPVWMVHLDGAFPIGYDDSTLQAIQASGGGSVASVEEALRRLAVGLAGATAPVTGQDVVDGYLWTTASAEQGGAGLVADEDFAPLAARRLILAEMRRQRGALGQVETLDQLHTIAIEQSIVTPYSSMIVLVNSRQQRLLDQLEARADRFTREHEAVGETAEADALVVTAVPEPEEWLLIGLATAMLGWYAYTRRHHLLQGHSGGTPPG
jgi:putative PEP-CTERM system integral membrane protein